MNGQLAAGFADLDTGRKERTGFAEVVFCQGKEDAFLRDIFARLYGANGEVMGTRATPAQYEVVRSVLPGAKYDAVSRLITVRKEVVPEPDAGLIGNIAVCTAGTADIAVAEEAAQAMPYYVAAQQLLPDLVMDYSGMLQMYNLLISQLDTSIPGENVRMTQAFFRG